MRRDRQPKRISHAVYASKNSRNPLLQSEVKSVQKVVLSVALLVSVGTSVYGANCVGLPSESDLKSALIASGGNHAGGLFNGTRMWAAVVNRDGEVCGFVTSTADPSQVWPAVRPSLKQKHIRQM